MLGWFGSLGNRKQRDRRSSKHDRQPLRLSAHHQSPNLLQCRASRPAAARAARRTVVVKASSVAELQKQHGACVFRAPFSRVSTRDDLEEELAGVAGLPSQRQGARDARASRTLAATARRRSRAHTRARTHTKKNTTGIAGSVAVVEGKGGLPTVVLTHANGASAQVCCCWGLGRKRQRPIAAPHLPNPPNAHPTHKTKKGDAVRRQRGVVEAAERRRGAVRAPRRRV